MSASGGIGGAPLTGPGVCQPDAADCTIGHASTGWCLAATGQPVIVVTKIACEPNDADPTITMILASTGEVVATQAVVPCAGNDWEIETLCDFDEFGEVIAVVTQIFQWNEATEQLTVRLVRADDPDGPPYVVQGQLRQCSDPAWVDVELAMVCATNGAGDRRQLSEMVVWDTRNGSLLSSFYLDAEGAVTPLAPDETVTVGDCWTPTLPAILDELEEANGHLTDLNAEADTQTGVLNQIQSNTDQIEPKLDTVNANLGVLHGDLAAINANTDNVETLLTAGNANTTTIAGAVKAEDAAAANGDAGIPALARRNDNAAATTSTDGDYTHIATDAAGRVGITDLGGSVSIDDNGGSITVDGSVAVTNFPASFEIANDVGNPIPVSGTVAVSNFPASVEVSNDVGNPIPISGTVTITDGAGPVTVDGTVTAAEAKAEDAPAANGDPGIPVLGVRNDAAAVRTSADGDYGNIALDSAGRVGISTLGATLAVTDAALAVTNQRLLDIAGYTDGIEGLLTAISGTNTNILARLTTSNLLPPGQVAVGVAAVQMHPAGQAVQQGVIVQAHPNNPIGSIVYVGVAGVTVGTGFPLAPGASVTLPIPNTNQVYLIGSQAALTAAWIEV